MALEIDHLDLDLALWPGQEQTFHLNKLPYEKPLESALNNDNELDYQCIDEFFKSIENGFQNDPDLKVNTKVDSQFDFISHSDIDSFYLNSSTFLSPPPSLPPSSPVDQYERLEQSKSWLQDLLLNAEPDQNAEHGLNAEHNQHADNCTSVMQILDSLLANPSIDDDLLSPQSYADSIEIDEVDVKPKRANKRRNSNSSNESDDPEWDPKGRSNKKCRKSSVPVEVKKLRKKDQNKTAANRYRIKKREEQKLIENLQEREENIHEQLKQTLEKLQMEFKVVFPLAKTAFATDPSRLIQLQAIQSRVFNEKLLD